MKHDIFAFQRARNICPAISLVLLGHTAFHTPTATASVDKLEKPQSAYVPNVLDLICNQGMESYSELSQLKCDSTKNS